MYISNINNNGQPNYYVILNHKDLFCDISARNILTYNT